MSPIRKIPESEIPTPLYLHLRYYVFLTYTLPLICVFLVVDILDGHNPRDVENRHLMYPYSGMRGLTVRLPL